MAETTIMTGAGTTDGAPTDPCDGQPDIGAYEWREAAAWVYLSLVLKGD